MSAPVRYLLAQHIELARVTLELDSPLRIGTGQRDAILDQTFVVDVNGLPAIPGTSIAGVVRAAWPAAGLPALPVPANLLFGFQDRDGGVRSRVTVSWAHVHDANNRPVATRQTLDTLDEVLRLVTSGVRRDHVRIDEKGVVDERGKFESRLVPRGARFTFEIQLDHHDGAPKGEPLLALLALLDAPSTRLGGLSTRGAGAFTIQDVRYRAFDLARDADRKAWSTLPAKLDEPATALEPRPKLPSLDADKVITCALSLQPDAPILVGSGAAPLDRNRKTDALDPVTESIITWNKGRATVATQQVVFPAAGIKGALRHRATFHARAKAGATLHFDDRTGTSTLDEGALRRADEAMVALFGEANDEGSGQRGRVQLEDLWPRQHLSMLRQHVSLDRFSGGPMDGLLFADAPLLVADQLALRVLVTDANSLPALAREALDAALRDLATGRLAIGHATSRGYGTFRSVQPPAWSDAAWLAGGAA
jgi:CRISPR/Cas system CSM-associated protein Csm3 (group 7 of RAMP superfamily)